MLVDSHASDFGKEVGSPYPRPHEALNYWADQKKPPEVEGVGVGVWHSTVACPFYTLFRFMEGSAVCGWLLVAWEIRATLHT